MMILLMMIPIHPSGTAPKTGKTIEPTRPAKDGTNSSNSDPSLINPDAHIRI